MTPRCNVYAEQTNQQSIFRNMTGAEPLDPVENNLHIGFVHLHKRAPTPSCLRRIQTPRRIFTRYL